MSAPTAPGRNQSRWKGAVRRLVAAVVCVLGFLPVLAGAAEKTLPTSIAELELSFAPLVKKAAPAVVNIYATKAAQQLSSPLFDDPFFRRFFSEVFPSDPMGPGQNSLGSGVIVRIDGLIVTNYHVVKDADAINVVLADRREFPAEVLRMDERTDLAVVKIDVAGERLPFLELMDSDAIEVGDLVLAIGNPFGVGQTVTSGIVSALGRTSVNISDFRSFIQTDAAINPGNSGGALVGMDGRLAGINTAIFTQSGTASGIGFAIPSNMVAVVIAGVTSGVPLVRPWLGARGQTVTAEIAESLGMRRPLGVLVNKIYPSGPAGQAGVRLGDVIFAVDDHEVPDAEALQFRIATRAVGDRVRLSVFRKGGEMSVEATLVAPPEDPPRNETLLEGSHPLSGATVVNLSPAVAEELSAIGVPDSGVIIMELHRGTPAALMRFSPGDLVIAVNEHEIETVADLERALRDDTRDWRITVRRGSQLINMMARR